MFVRFILFCCLFTLTRAALQHTDQKHIQHKKIEIIQSHATRIRHKLAAGHKSELEVLSENVFNDICLWSDQTVCDNIKAAGHKYLQKHGFSVKIVHDFLKHSETITLEQTYCSTPQRNSDDNCLCHQLFANTFVNKNPFDLANDGCPDGYSLLTNQICFKHHGEDHQYGQCHQKCGECLVEDVSDICAVGQPGTNCWDKCAKNKKVQDFWLAAEQKACHCSTYNRDFAHQCNQDMACTWVAGRQSCIPYDGKYECLFKCAENPTESVATCECKCQAVIERETDPHNKICHTYVHDKLDLNSWLISEARPSLFYKEAGFDIGYGQCPTYGAGKKNHRYCSMDKIKGNKGCYNKWCRQISWIGGPGNEEEKQYTQIQTTPATVWCEQCHNDDKYHYNALRKSKVDVFAEYADYAYGGCKTADAENYNPQALVDAPHTCVISGCTNQHASNYRPDATQPDPNIPCLYLGCMDPSADNYNQYATQPDPEKPCIISGCTISGLPHYNPSATLNNGKCCNEGYKYENEQCLECPAGTFAQQHSDQCTLCGGNTYSNAGSSQCNLCKDGYTHWNGQCVTQCQETQVLNNEGRCDICWNPSVYEAREAENKAKQSKTKTENMKASVILEQLNGELDQIERDFNTHGIKIRTDNDLTHNIDIANCQQQEFTKSEKLDSFDEEIENYKKSFDQQQEITYQADQNMTNAEKRKDEALGEVHEQNKRLDEAHHNADQAETEVLDKRFSKDNAYQKWQDSSVIREDTNEHKIIAIANLDKFNEEQGGKLNNAKQVLKNLTDQHFRAIDDFIDILQADIIDLDTQIRGATDMYEKMDLEEEKNIKEGYLEGNITKRESDNAKKSAAEQTVELYGPVHDDLSKKVSDLSEMVLNLEDVENIWLLKWKSSEEDYNLAKQEAQSAQSAIVTQFNIINGAESALREAHDIFDHTKYVFQVEENKLQDIMMNTKFVYPIPTAGMGWNIMQYLVQLREIGEQKRKEKNDEKERCLIMAEDKKTITLEEDINQLTDDFEIHKKEITQQMSFYDQRQISLEDQLNELIDNHKAIMLDAQVKRAGAEQRGIVCGCMDSSASSFVSAAVIPDPSNKCVYACQVTSCKDWNCDEWCQCFREEENDVYVANGCTENSENTCTC